MEKIISKLNSDLIKSLGFDFDGYYYIYPKCPILKLVATAEDAFLVEIEGAAVGQNPPPITTNTQLYQLLVTLFGWYLENSLKNRLTPLTEENQEEELNRYMTEYFAFDSKLKFKFTGQGLIPSDEYTYTVMSGIEVEFKVYFDFEMKEFESLSINPDCISYNYLKKRFDKSPKAVKVIQKDGLEYPFFGMGIPMI